MRLLATALLLSSIVRISALWAAECTTIYMFNRGGKAQDGLWLAKNPGGLKQLLGTNDSTTIIKTADFSPDGKRIAYLKTDGVLRIMNNDGKNIVDHIPMRADDESHITWTTVGIYFQRGKYVYRYIPETGIKDTIASLPNGDVHRLFVSRDGRRAWIRIGQTQTVCENDPICTYELENLAENKNYNPPQMFGYPYITWNADISDYTLRLFAGHGHGAGITGDGKYVMLNTGFYLPANVDKNTLEQVGGGSWGQAHQTWLSIDHETYAMKIHIPKRKDGMPGFGGARPVANDPKWVIPETHWGMLYNYETYDTLVTMDGPEASIPGGAWLGTLPTPADGPDISVSPSELIIAADMAQATMTSVVTVANVGTGTLTKVDAAVKTSSDWLSVDVEGSGGNSQTITNTITTAGLASDINTATVEVSGGGASQAVEYTVTVTKGSAIAAPGSLAATAAGADMQDVVLTWSDNSNNEDGFIIERADSSGSFIEVGKVGAGATTFTENSVDLGSYQYRVAAYKGSDISSYSNVVPFQVAGVPYIVVTEPVAGEVIRPGSVAHIRWDVNLVGNIQIDYTKDMGSNWVEITQTGGVLSGDPNWRDYEWTVPNALDGENILIRVRKYGETSPAGITQGTILVSSTAAVRQRDRSISEIAPGLLIKQDARHLHIRSGQGVPFVAKVIRPDGKVVARSFSVSGATISLPLSSAGSAVYYVQVAHGDERVLKRISMTK
ncbi:MAG: hypothetical protein GF398_05985 [Chitinivibrionales bacterium]|nr:hypothetical protein [Chitinivibrionales bacterium]